MAPSTSGSTSSPQVSAPPSEADVDLDDLAASERAVCILGETNSAALVVSNELLALINLDAGRLELVDHSACRAASTRNARSSDERLEEVVTTPTAARVQECPAATGPASYGRPATPSDARGRCATKTCPPSPKQKQAFTAWEHRNAL